MRVVCCLSSCVAGRRPLLLVCWLLIAACCLLVVVVRCCSLCVTCPAVSAAYYGCEFVGVRYCLLFAASCVFAACGLSAWLFVVGCLLFAVCC